MNTAKTVLTATLKKCSWVLFKNNSVVLVKGPLTDEALEKAIKTMKDMGPVIPGTPLGDFNVLSLGEKGWLIASHCSELMTYVSPDEMSTETDDYMIGLYGRNNRDKDSKDAVVVHKHMWNESDCDEQKSS